jgi:hypothetical protein
MCRALYNAFFAFTLLLLISPVRVFADTLFISPLTGTYTIGESFSLRVMVSSPRQAINAISGVVSYPIDKLQVTSVSKIGSVLSLWVQEPFFSNSRGTVSFEGVVPNPGFNESNGRVLAVNFKVVGTGPAEVKLASGSLLANDGMGTNVLKTLGSAVFSLEQGLPQLPVTPPAITETSEDTGGAEAPVIIDFGKIETAQKEKKTPSLSEVWPGWGAVANGLLKFFSVVIPLLALIFFLVHTTKRGVGNIRALQRSMRKDLHGLDHFVAQSFDILREDVSDCIRILEKAKTTRRLTAEEAAIVQSLKRNLRDTENAIHQKMLKVEKELDD